MTDPRIRAPVWQRVVDILESYGPFEAPSPHNPCMRTAKRGAFCISWGFAVFAYRNTTGIYRAIADRGGTAGRGHARAALGKAERHATTP